MAEREVKRELVPSPQGSAAERPVSPRSNEEYIVKQEAAEGCVKVEDSGGAVDSPQASAEGADEAEWSGVSAAAARAGLYDEHEVKRELLLGPERLQPQDIAYTLPVASNRAEECVEQEPVLSGGAGEGTGGSAWPAQNLHLSSCLEQPVHRTCFVRLQHLPAYSEPRRAQHSRANVHSSGIHRKIKLMNVLIIHKIIRRGENPFTCEICKKQFTRNSNLERHMRIHTGEKPFTCEICKKQFTRNSDLKNHMRIHMGEKRFACEICKKQFTKNSNLQIHIRLHTGENPFTCQICKKQFTYKSSLNTHMKIHTGEKLLTCEICKKQFTKNSHLQRHMRTHIKDNPFKCEICKKQFTQRSHLKNHIRIHTGEKLFTCEICKKQFTRNSNLQTHMGTHTGENS